MVFISSVLVAALAAGVSALPAATNYVVHEKRNGQVESRGERVSRDTIIPVRIGLRQANIAKGHDLLMDISHPTSSNYGKHLSREEVNRLFAPAHQTVQAVTAWLETAGISNDTITVLDKGWLAFDVATKDAEALFQAQYYEHDEQEGKVKIGCDEYSLPQHIAPHIDYIRPGVVFSPRLTKRSRPVGHGRGPHYSPPNRWPQPPRGPLGGIGVTPWSQRPGWHHRHWTTPPHWSYPHWHTSHHQTTSSGQTISPPTTCQTSTPPSNTTTPSTSDQPTTTPPSNTTTPSRPDQPTTTPPSNTTTPSTSDQPTTTPPTTSPSTSPSPSVTPTGCDQIVSPDCIRFLYSIPTATLNDSVNALGIFEEPPSYNQQDLDNFFAKWAPQVPAGTHPEARAFDGGEAALNPAQQSASIEANVDFEVAYALIYPQQTVLYQDGGSLQGEPDETIFNGFFDAVDGSFCNDYESSNVKCGIYDLTRVLSVSYGQTELTGTPAGQRRVCDEIMKLSLQGHTLVFASGDYGVATTIPSDGNNGCYDPVNGQGNGTVFSPNFPTTCPYVLSVGATMIASGQPVTAPESVMNVPSGIGAADPALGITFSSTGGFANYFPAPDYQSAALATYFASFDPGYPSYTYNNDTSSIGANGGKYNRAGRGIPDISANGVNIAGSYQGQNSTGYGTSYAAPQIASIFTLINQERTAAGKGPVGFVQPTLYQHPEAFHDITEGDNAGCNTNGFQAVPGWDPVTGLGTPNYPALLDIFMALP